MLLALVTAFILPSYAAPSAHHITTAEELFAISEDPSGSYILDNDIDLSGYEWIPVEFNGVFDGNGFAILNLRVNNVPDEVELTFDGNMKRYESTHFAGFFSICKGASIKNATFLGMQINIDTDSDCYCAAIAGYAIDTVIKNCDIECSIELRCGGKNQGVGGVIGFGDSTVNSCSIDSELIQADTRDPKNGKAEEFLGGVIASGLCIMNDNTVNIDAYIACNGYVHSGGMAGMLYRLQFDNSFEREILNNTVSGKICFYENNRDRRAYCDAIVGEKLPCWYIGLEEKNNTNNTAGFIKDELFDYDTEPNPEKCTEPDISVTVVEQTCTEFGYTIITCSGCGYERKTDYTLKAHADGELEVLTPADYTHEGSAIAYCRYCGIELGERVLPVLEIPGGSAELSETYMLLEPESKAEIRAEAAGDSAFSDYIWASSNESIVTVDANGNIRAHRTGDAEITCSLPGGLEIGTCDIVVRYSVKQLIFRYLFFGWYWDRG